jgi:F-type H+-transporting ATPase subunit epsilon
MAMQIHVDIVSAEGAIHSGSATMLYAPGEMGELGIAARHAPLITRLKPGDVRVEDDHGNMEHF